MTARPIIFSAAMVRALLDGRKTMTRRLAWAAKPRNIFDAEFPTVWQKVAPGDRLWVRETHYVWDSGNRDRSGQKISYRATTPEAPCEPWTPSIHMPRWASRLTLEVTATKIERLQDISEADVIAEGLAKITKDARRTWKFGLPDRDGFPGNDDHGWPWSDWNISPQHAFGTLWDRVHGEDAWAENPEVVALTFTVHQRNLDAMKDAA